MADALLPPPPSPPFGPPPPPCAPPSPPPLPPHLPPYLLVVIAREAYGPWHTHGTSVNWQDGAMLLLGAVLGALVGYGVLAMWRRCRCQCSPTTTTKHAADAVVKHAVHLIGHLASCCRHHSDDNVPLPELQQLSDPVLPRLSDEHLPWWRRQARRDLAQHWRVLIEDRYSEALHSWVQSQPTRPRTTIGIAWHEEEACGSLSAPTALARVPSSADAPSPAIVSPHYPCQLRLAPASAAALAFAPTASPSAVAASPLEEAPSTPLHAGTTRLLLFPSPAAVARDAAECETCPAHPCSVPPATPPASSRARLALLGRSAMRLLTNAVGGATPRLASSRGMAGGNRWPLWPTSLHARD